jgi:hypothetical protein
MTIHEPFFTPEVEFARTISQAPSHDLWDESTASRGFAMFAQLPAGIGGLVASLLLFSTAPAMSEARVVRAVIDPAVPAANAAKRSQLRVVYGADLKEPEAVGSSFWSFDLGGTFDDVHPVNDA